MNSTDFLTSTSKFTLYQEKKEGEYTEVYSLFAGDLLEASLLFKGVFNPDYKKSELRDAKEGDVIHDLFSNKACLLCEIGFIEIVHFTVNFKPDEK